MLISVGQMRLLNESKMMAFEKDYYWVVLCKSRLCHFLQNRSMPHTIMLGETDSVSAPPRLEGGFRVKCDDCGKEYVYHSADLLRFEAEPPEFFVAHPLFRRI
jgi:hypothetical protein